MSNIFDDIFDEEEIEEILKREEEDEFNFEEIEDDFDELYCLGTEIEHTEEVIERMEELRAIGVLEKT